ncbi:vomeronasal type-2 receptor 116-like [Thomomys bottae]
MVKATCVPSYVYLVIPISSPCEYLLVQAFKQNLYRFPQLNFGRFDPVLSDHRRFPAVYQVAPKDTALALAMVALMVHFSWNWVMYKRLPIMYVSYNFNNYQLVIALAFAVEEINKNPHLLPNTTLGFSTYSTGEKDKFDFRNLVFSLSGEDLIFNYNCKRGIQTLVALSGPSGTISSECATLFDLYRFPQLNFGRFDPVLSDHCRFPAVYQVAPKDTALALAMVALMVHFSWNWVGLVISEEESGLRMLPQLREEMSKRRICTAFEHLVALQDPEHASLHRKIRNSVVNIIVIYVSPAKYPEDYYLALLWIKYFNCTFSESSCVTWKNCPANASLEWLPRFLFEMDMLEESYNIYNAVYAVAHALHEMLIDQAEAQAMGNGSKLVFSPSQLHPFLKNTHFNNPAGDQVILDEPKRLVAEYDIVNFWNFPEGLRQVVKVGTFSPYEFNGHQLSLSTDMIEWPIAFTETPQSICSDSCGPGFRKSPQEGSPACCFDCIPCPENEISNRTDMEQCVRCPDHQYANMEKTQCLLKSESFLDYQDPLGMALACSAVSLSTLTAAITGIFVKHHHTPIVKANNRALSYILLISLNCSFLCSLLAIGHPNTATCILQQTTFAVVFTVAVSSVLAKTLTVVLAFSAATSSWTRMRPWLVSGRPNFLIPLCTLIQLIVCGVWLGTSPPFLDTDAHSEHGHILILCNKGSTSAFYCVLGFLGSLALASFTVAFLARNLPDTFNEAKFLTFSMLLFCSVWLTFLPVYHSTQGKTMVAVEVFSSLASSAGLLGCIFVPKCYIILFRPHRNSLPAIRGQTRSGRKKSSQ